MGISDGQKSGTKRLSKSQLQDDSIMGTNNSSIVSKRSVERLYFPDEPHFFRFFVKKPQRRSPLINRGYWLRMKAIDKVVQNFLEESSDKRKVVVNLGCGYDPLPWQCFSRYAEACEDVLFIDIDYRDLMLRKRTVVQEIPALNAMLHGLEVSDGDVLLRSQQYLQIGCDLRDLTKVEAVLSSVIDLGKCLILFTAEVSITYMSVETADALIRWCGSLKYARFCLLEQILPEGADHPFAQTMLAHFDKLQTSLHAVRKYPTTEAQENRFTNLGWKTAFARNLWELWASDFVGCQQRKDLDQIEPFDEWEEFSLFACHYFLLVGSTTPKSTLDETNVEKPPPTLNTTVAAVDFSENPKSRGCRRFAAVMSLRSQDRACNIIGTFGGMGLTTRLNSYDEYKQAKHAPYHTNAPDIVPSARMCHTISALQSNSTALLVGGRTSPDKALRDCWIFHRFLSIWERVDDLPWPLYRHQAVALSEEYILISTGRTNSCAISDKYLIWSRQRGWVPCTYGSENKPLPVFGQALWLSPTSLFADGTATISGFMAGGISESGIIVQESWSWEVAHMCSENPSISFRRLNNHSFCRFGAALVRQESKVILVGGIVPDSLLDMGREVCIIEGDAAQHVPLKLSPGSARPLLIGTCVTSADNSLQVFGGGAVCFSMGTFWNKGSFQIRLVDSEASENSGSPALLRRPMWEFSRTVIPSSREQGDYKASDQDAGLFKSHEIAAIPRIHLQASVDCPHILREGKPVIFEHGNIGGCMSKWSVEYLKERVGGDREIVVHEAQTTHMDFTSKNFAYTSMPFGNFLERIEVGEKLYLRSLSSEGPSTLPTSLERDFPSIADDFHIPSELAFVAENMHSAPLRISGPVKMWLHYDVCSNILCQIKGTKRLILYPPNDYKYFDLEPGASSSSVDVFERLQKSGFPGSRPHEAILQPGDILFIPALWLHTAVPMSTTSIAVNVFFRDLEAGYAPGKDVYGNRDLQAYEKGRQDISKILATFKELPRDVKSFYINRLADELKQKVNSG